MRNKPVIIIVFVLFIVVVIGLVYAAFTQNLNISGTGNVRNSKWKIYFSRLSTATTTGTATVSMPTLAQNATSIGDYTATVMSPGDSISFEVDVTNDGDYDALLSSVTINGTPTCKYNNSTEDTSAVNVCNNLTYTIKYKGGASLIANTDVLHSKETQTMVVELKYANITNSTLLPTHDIDITGLGITLTYVQSGNAKVNEDGTTPIITYDTYAVGDRIQVVGDTSGAYYYVIAPSGSNQDYVVALKENPLSVSEVNTYGIGHINQYANISQGIVFNQNGYGGIQYYSSSTCGYINDSRVESGCMNSYNASEIKYVVDNWKIENFIDNQLKPVNGYEARLISYEELQQVGWPSCTSVESLCKKESTTLLWLYNSNYWYWTMSQWHSGSSLVWIVDDFGALSGSLIDNAGGVVRPVINVYKSKIVS